MIHIVKTWLHRRKLRREQKSLNKKMMSLSHAHFNGFGDYAREEGSVVTKRLREIHQELNPKIQ